MKNITFFIMLLALLFVSCESQKTTIWSAEQEEKENSTENRITSNQIKATYDLTSQLRGVSGLRIKGSGASAEITIRGGNSLQLSNEPLFVIDGIQFNGDYTRLYYFIDSNQIKSITVLKDVASTGFYGVNGANGVIEIKLKN